MRPLDQRWDHSRGLVFNSTPPGTAPRDCTWSRSNGIIFAPSRTQSRGYAVRALGVKSPPPRARTPPAQQPSREDSLLNNPHNIPQMPIPTSEKELALRLQREHDTWRSQVAALEEEVKTLKALNQKATSQEEKLKQERFVDRQKAQEQETRHRNALEAVKREERERLKGQMRATELKMSQASRRAEEARASAAEYQERVVRLEERLSRELMSQRQTLGKLHEAELQAVRSGRRLRKDREREDYESYRKVFDDVNDTMKRWAETVVQLENAYLVMARRVLKEQKPYADQLARHKPDPWFRNKYPELLNRLDNFVEELHIEAERSGQAIRSLRTEQQDIQELFRRSSHVSRALTRYHRMEQEPGKFSMADMLAWAAHQQPLGSRRDELDRDIRDLERLMKKETNEKVVAGHRSKLDELGAARRSLNKVLSVMTKFRDTEALTALMADSIEEKEVFAATLRATSSVDTALGSFKNVTGDDPIADSESDVPVGEQRTLRRDFLDKSRELRGDIKDIASLIRRRSLLEQALGRVPSNREADMDQLIERRIHAKKQEELAAFANLGIEVASWKSRRSRMAKSETSTSSMASPTRTSSRAVATPLPEVTFKTDQKQLERRIRELKQKVEKESDPAAKALLLRELLPLRQKMKNGYIAVLEAKKAGLVRQPGHDKQQLRRIEHELNTLRSTMGDTSITSGSRRARREERRRRAAAYPSLESSQPLPAGSAPLNIKPTAAMQAATSSWPRGSRLYHETDNARLDVVGEHTWQARQLPEFNPYYFSSNASQERSSSTGFEAHAITESGPAMSQHSRFQIEHSAAKATSEPSMSESDSSAGRSSRLKVAGGSDPHTGSEPAPPSATQEIQLEYPLEYQIPAADYRNAVTASRNCDAAFWSYKMYKNKEGKTPAVHFCSTAEQAEKQVQSFLKEPVLGFDIEWVPNTRKMKGRTIKDEVSLLQLAAEEKICVFHIARFTGDDIDQLMPPSLRQVLESESILKTGVNVAIDSRRLREHFNVNMKGLFELSHLYKVVRFADQPKKINKALLRMADQVETVLLLPLKKDEDVRASVWTKPLSLQQVSYSASDAYAGFRLFHALERERIQMKPMPPRPSLYEKQEPLVLGDGTVLKKSSSAAASRKVAGEAEEPEDEFFDALETQEETNGEANLVAGVPLSGLRASYPILPVVESSRPFCVDNEADANDERLVIKQEMNAASLSEVQRAGAWVDSWKESLPANHTLKCGNASLRAWHLWHEQGRSINEVAGLLRDPPLASRTVASYVLQAIDTEGLPFDVQRTKEALNLIPNSVHWRYKKVADKLHV